MADYPQSRAIFERAARAIPAGVSTNTRARAPHPLYFDKAEGAGCGMPTGTGIWTSSWETVPFSLGMATRR